jgi:YesN/AraC family two-component response regulator
MNTILLVDDDNYVIDGLLKHIPWEEMGVRIIGTAADGAEGLQKFRELQPDFVITDIYMPIMDGFQLTEAIHAINPEVPVVILSGYDNLANARQAVSKGIHHFLLKPPSVTEIEFVVREVLQQLNESRERDELLSHYLQQQHIVRQSMKDAFFRDMLSTRYRPAELPQSRIAFMGLPDTPEVQALTLSLVRSDVSARKEEREWQLLRFGTGNIIQEVLDTRLAQMSGVMAETVQYSDQEFVVIFIGELTQDAEVQQRLLKLSGVLLENILQFMKLSVLAGMGTPRQGYHQLIDSYLESRRALETAEMNEWNRVYTYAETSASERKGTVSLEAVRDIHDAIFQKRWLHTLDLWKQFAAELSADVVPLPVLKAVCAGIATSLWTAIQSTGQESEAAIGSLDELLLQLNRRGSARELLEWMDGTVTKLIQQIRDVMQGKKSHALVDRVIRDYIEKCYHEDISLEKIAAELHVNRNYLSQLFKRITGEPFVTYFNKYRIQKAKELILTGNYMIYEVSEMVGFQNSTYFSQVFKSITGCSPSEYNQ